MTPSRLIESVLFPCPEPSYTIGSFPGELIWIPKVSIEDLGTSQAAHVKSSQTVPCLLNVYESAKYLLIFFHSNAEDIGRARWFCKYLSEQFQVHVLSVEYPGYGVCPGPVSREGILDNAYSALHFATEVLGMGLEQIKVMGRSIGTGPAIFLAARFRVAGLILITPFESIHSLVRDKVGLLAFLADEWFTNDENIQKVRSPTLIIHGKDDKIVPYRHAEAVYSNCKARKLLINPANMDHNANLTVDLNIFAVPMFRFFSLPDYSFKEFKVPPWVYDKRRSPLYVKPEMEVFSDKKMSDVLRGSAGTNISLPVGDDEVDPVDLAVEMNVLLGQDSAQVGLSNLSGYKSRIRALCIINRTVRHLYRPTKQRYDFTGDLAS